MIRWLRAIVAVVLVLLLVAICAVVSLLLAANGGYVELHGHPWLGPILDPLLAGRALEVQMPALLAGWLIAIFASAGLAGFWLFYVWRRRQYERLIRRLERELVELRNLPFTDPAPLEDLPERPDQAAAAELDDAMADVFGTTRRSAQAEPGLGSGPGAGS